VGTLGTGATIWATPNCNAPRIVLSPIPPPNRSFEWVVKLFTEDIGMQTCTVQATRKKYSNLLSRLQKQIAFKMGAIMATEYIIIIMIIITNILGLLLLLLLSDS